MAATSEVEIMNSALVKLGAERIVDPDDANIRARLCKERYPHVRDALLRSHPWNFCTAYSELAVVDPKPADVFDYQYVFQLPANCSRVFKTDLSYDVEWEEIVGARIATNASSVIVKYGQRITDVTKYDDSFIEVLAWALAADIAYALTQSTAQRDEAKKSFKDELAVARSYDAQVGSVRRVISDEWLDARRS